MFGEQLLDMRRAVERRDELPEPRGHPGDQNIGKAAAGFFRGVRRRDLGGQRALMQPLDDGAEQRFLGFEMVVERLPRQPGGLGRLLDRRAPETVPAEHGHGGIENAVAWLHLSILTKQKEMSNNEAVWADAAAGSAAHACQISSAAALDRAGYKLVKDLKHGLPRAIADSRQPGHGASGNTPCADAGAGQSGG